MNPNVWTFAAYDEGRLAGTVSLRLDSPEGVAADALYRAEIDAIRRDQHRVCEFTRLAVVRVEALAAGAGGPVPHGLPVRVACP
mgnify:CR=1 FL=1